MSRTPGSALFGIIVLAMLFTGGVARAQSQCTTPSLSVGEVEVHSIAASTAGVPVECTFSISTAGTYQVTLTDLGADLSPAAPLQSVELAVTNGNALVGAPLAAAGTLTLSSIKPGTYVLHVVGMPGNVPGSGPIGIVVAASGGAQVASFQQILQLPSQALPNGEGVLQDSFSITSTGSYTVSLNDLQLPQSLSTLTLLLIAQGSATPTLILPTAGNAYQSTLSLAAGTYEIFAVGQAANTVNAGLFSAVVAASGAAPVYGRAVAVGGTMHLGTVPLAAGNYTLHLTDLAFPAALTELGGVLLLSGQPAASLAAAGSQNFAATAGTYDAYGVGTAATAAPGAGSYALQVTPQGSAAPAFDVAQGVTASGSALTAYDFATTIATGGQEMVSLTDFQFPAALTSVTGAAEQRGALLGAPFNSASSASITAAAGPLSLVVFAQAQSAAGLFGIDITPASGPAVFDITQAVGAIFSVQPITITTAGNYSVTASDLGFPATFANFDTIVTRGTSQAGSIFGGGTFNFTATPGTYYVNLIAQPSGSAQAGTYAIEVASAPAAPTVSLTTDESQVSSGSTVNLIWSSQNATSCTASGGWSGTQATSGQMTSAALTHTTTFTLTCKGAGGSASKSASVTVTASGGGGGGSLDCGMLLVLLALFAVRFVIPSSRRLPTVHGAKPQRAGSDLT